MRSALHTMICVFVNVWYWSDSEAVSILPCEACSFTWSGTSYITCYSCNQIFPFADETILQCIFCTPEGALTAHIRSLLQALFQSWVLPHWMVSFWLEYWYLTCEWRIILFLCQDIHHLYTSASARCRMSCMGSVLSWWRHLSIQDCFRYVTFLKVWHVCIAYSGRCIQRLFIGPVIPDHTRSTLKTTL